MTIYLVPRYTYLCMYVCVYILLQYVGTTNTMYSNHIFLLNLAMYVGKYSVLYLIIYCVPLHKLGTYVHNNFRLRYPQNSQQLAFPQPEPQSLKCGTLYISSFLLQPNCSEVILFWQFVQFGSLDKKYLIAIIKPCRTDYDAPLTRRDCKLCFATYTT